MKLCVCVLFGDGGVCFVRWKGLVSFCVFLFDY